jgi:glutaminyl-tRNA synthetase
MSDTKDGKKDFIREIIAEDLASGKHETTITRFPPEPNGYLHIGHAKAICLNFGLAQENAETGARCHLRFDDTNPSKEDQEYVDSIKEDVQWLGFDWKEHLYFASNYFEYFYECAVALINQGLAYVDEQSGDEIRAGRGNLTEPGTESPFRNRSVEENLALFARMRAGEFKDGEVVLRAKIDMTAPNLNLRDPLLYRVLHATHHNTGDAWCIYPLYDFAHPLEDAKESITHSLCTLEFEDHRPLYEWVVEHCPVASKPRQIEFSRLNINYTVMSKRKFIQMVDEKVVSGWDDPRMVTLSGMRRRGYPAVSLRNFVKGTGITKFKGVTDVAVLEHEVRTHLNKIAPRRMAVLDPIKLVMTNYPAGESEEVSVPNNPEDETTGVRMVPLSREIWIERDDFMADPPKKYFRLAPGKAVRLRGGYIVLYQDHVTDPATGAVTEVHVEFLPGTIGQSAPEGVKCKAAIHWVSAATSLEAEVRLYDRLFSEENPDKAENGFMSCLNPESLKVIKGAQVEPSLSEVTPGYSCQFERLGYFCADARDHVAGEHLVFNRTIGLRDSWSKKR